MQELNLRSLPTAPYDVSNAILPPPSGVENVVAPTQAPTPDSSWLPSREVLTPGTTRRCESIARRGLLCLQWYHVSMSRVYATTVISLTVQVQYILVLYSTVRVLPLSSVPHGYSSCRSAVFVLPLLGPSLGCAPNISTVPNMNLIIILITTYIFLYTKI